MPSLPKATRRFWTRQGLFRPYYTGFGVMKGGQSRVKRVVSQRFRL